MINTGSVNSIDNRRAGAVSKMMTFQDCNQNSRRSSGKGLAWKNREVSESNFGYLENRAQNKELWVVVGG